MDHGQVRYGNAYSPYPYGTPSANVSTSSLASTSSKILNLFKSNKPPPVPEKDYPYLRNNPVPSSSTLSLAATVSDAGTTASGRSATGSTVTKKKSSLFGYKRSKKNKESDPDAISLPWNVKHEMHVDDSLNGFPSEWNNALLQLGYSPDDIQEMANRRRRNPSQSAIPLPIVGNNATAPPIPSTSVPYRYPTPPAQYSQTAAPPSLTLQTNGISGPLRNLPQIKTSSPASSLRSSNDILRGSPTTSSSNAHRTAVSPAVPSRPPPPQPLISDIAVRKANTYKPSTVIAVQGDSDDEAPLSSLKAAPQSNAQPPVSDHNQPSHELGSKPNDPPTREAIDVPAPNLAQESNKLPRISLTGISNDFSLKLNLTSDERNSVDWSESLFSALPSANAFRNSMIRTPISGSSGSRQPSPSSEKQPVRDSPQPLESSVIRNPAQISAAVTQPQPAQLQTKTEFSTKEAHPQSNPTPLQPQLVSRSVISASENEDSLDEDSTYRASITSSSYAYDDVDEHDEHEEGVVVTGAMAVKLVRAPSMSLANTVNILRQGSGGEGKPGLVGKAVASAQVITMHGKTPSITFLSPGQLTSQPPVEALQAQQDLYRNASFLGDDDDYSDEDDPESRNTIRLDTVKADQLMAAVMENKGVVNGVDKTIQDSQNHDRRASIATIQAAPSGREGRPKSTDTIQAVKVKGNHSQDALHADDYDFYQHEDEDTSALDEWLEANESDDEVDDEAPVILPTPTRAIKEGASDGSDEYDDTDRPLNAKASRRTSAFLINSRSQNRDTMRSSIDPLSPAYSESSIGEEVAHTNKHVSCIDASDRERIVSMGIALPDSPFVLSHVSLPGAHTDKGRARGFSKSSGRSSSSHVGTPGGGSGSGSSTGSSVKPQRSSVIYAPSLGLNGLSKTVTPASQPTIDSIVSGNTSPSSANESLTPQPFGISFDSPLVETIAAKLPAESQEIVNPILPFLQIGDPRWMYGDLTLVADGESGGVYSARILHEKGKQAKGRVAIKKIRVETENVEKMESLKREMQLFSQIRNEHILVYKGIWVVEDANQTSGANEQIQATINGNPHSELWVRMDLMERSLADLLSLLDEGLVLEEKHIARFAGDVASGLSYLENLFIAHRDIRSDNLLISGIDGSVKIADFSSAVQLSTNDYIRTDPVGIVYWQAPEVRRGPYDATKIDVWSLAATVWELIEGETPFENDPSGPGERLPDFTNVQDVSQGLIEFLAYCELPPGERPKAENLLDTPFILSACTRADISHLLSRARFLEQALSTG